VLSDIHHHPAIVLCDGLLGIKIERHLNLAFSIPWMIFQIYQLPDRKNWDGIHIFEMNPTISAFSLPHLINSLPTSLLPLMSLYHHEQARQDNSFHSVREWLRVHGGTTCQALTVDQEMGKRT
jgi:hypothetical protein